jgi:hypothetical protein
MRFGPMIQHSIGACSEDLPAYPSRATKSSAWAAMRRPTSANTSFSRWQATMAHQLAALGFVLGAADAGGGQHRPFLRQAQVSSK